VLTLVAAACVALAAQRSTLWNTELAALSPVPLADQQLDAALRADLGAPDVRHLVAIEAPDADTALARAEALAPALGALMTDGVIAGYQSPTDYLPSRATQQARIAALPAAGTLRANLAAALDGLPLRADKLAPFLADVEAARRASPLTPADLAGSSLGLGLEALLAKQADRWVALLPLRAPAEGVSIDAQRVRSAVAAANIPGALAIDLKAESDALYAGYLREAIVLSALGCAAIVALLALALRDAARVLRVVAPLAAAILLVAAGLALAGERMTLLHLVGMLLTVAVGSNYALFFAGNTAPEALPRTLASLAFANLTTVAAFGLLAFSHIPVLHAIGITVGPGAVLALLISAVFSKRLGG